MSERIEVGDLVMVVRGHECGKSKFIGIVFTVERIEQAYDYGCPQCGGDMSDGRLLAFGRRPTRTGFVPLSWLKKIPPLTESAETKEEMTA
jgi:hypothetical protein